MASKTGKTHPLRTIVLALAAAVVIVAGLALYFSTRSQQSSYFSGNEVKVIEIDTSTGPVSPPYQQSQLLILTPTTCNYTITKYSDGNNPQTSECGMDQQTWDTIIKAYNNNSVQNIIHSAPGSTSLLGGPNDSMSVTLADGTQLKAAITPQLKAQLDPFLQTLQQSVSQAGELKY